MIKSFHNTMIPKHTNHLSIKIVTPLWNGCVNAGSLPAKCSDKIYIPSLGFKINSQNFKIWRRVLQTKEEAEKMAAEVTKIVDEEGNTLADLK